MRKNTITATANTSMEDLPKPPKTTAMPSVPSRRLKRLVKGADDGTFHTVERTLEGIEAMHRLRKGQVRRLDGRGAGGRAFVGSLIGIAV